MKKAKQCLIALLSGVLLAITVLSGCGQSQKAVSKNDDHLTVYLWENRLMKNIVPYIHEQFPDQDIEFITGNNDTDLYSYFEEHGELPDIITVRRFSGKDAQDLEPYLMDFASYDVVSRYYSYALQYYKNSKNEIQWLPICGIPQTIIANKTLFEQYGIKIPKNYKEYAQACQQFYDNGIKPYSLDLAEDWSAHEVIQTGAIGEFMSLDGIEWRSSAESASGDIAFDDALWKRIFSETNTFLKDSHFTSDDISVDINTATQMFLEGKAAMFHGYPALMQEFQEQMDAELTRIPFFSQISDEAFINMTPSLNIAFNKETGEVIDLNLELDVEKIEEESKYDGYYSIVTSELNMSDIEIRKIYKGLSRIEETFRITKSELDTRPIHVTTNEHIESHFTTCFAAITLLRLLEISLGNKYPAPQIIESLRQFNCVNISSNIYRMTYTNEILKQCGALHDIDTGKKHRTKEEIRRILKY